MGKVGAQFRNGNGGVEFSYQLRDLRAAGTRPLEQRKERAPGDAVGVDREVSSSIYHSPVLRRLGSGHGEIPINPKARIVIQTC